jgi:hypothetical protein
LTCSAEKVYTLLEFNILIRITIFFDSWLTYPARSYINEKIFAAHGSYKTTAMLFFSSCVL